MSGHSKWSTIKRKKGSKDAAKGKVFSKLSKEIMIAAQSGGDLTTNFTLRLAVDKAKASNMPNDNIDRAIKKGSGQLQGEGDKVVALSYEAYGPGNAMLIIDCQTDNLNRSITDVKTTLTDFGAKMASEGSLSWQFDVQGWIAIEPKIELGELQFGKGIQYQDIDIDELQMNILEIPGIEDVYVEDNVVNLLTTRESFQHVRDAIMKQKYKIVDAELLKSPQSQITVSTEDSEQLSNLIGALEELDDVDQVWTNADLS